MTTLTVRELNPAKLRRWRFWVNVCFFLIFGLTLASYLVIGLFFAMESVGAKEGMARMTNFSGIFVTVVSILLLLLLIIVIFLSQALGHTIWGTIFTVMVCGCHVYGSDRTPVAWWLIVPIGAVFCVLSLNIQVSDALAACADVDSCDSDTHSKNPGGYLSLNSDSCKKRSSNDSISYL